MKNVFLAVILGFASLSVSAVETEATVSVTSDFVYRGQLVTEDPSVAVDFTVGNIWEGLFVTGSATTTELTPVSDMVRVRSEAGVGYAFGLGDLEVTTSVNRVFNPVVFSQNYNEARLTARYNWLFAEVGQGFTSDVNDDTYFAVGADFQPLDRVTVGGLVSAVRYDQDSERFISRSNSRFNHAEVFASWNVWQNLDLFANYTYGLRDGNGVDIDNRVYGGLRYSF